MQIISVFYVQSIEMIFSTQVHNTYFLSKVFLRCFIEKLCLEYKLLRSYRPTIKKVYIRTQYMSQNGVKNINLRILDHIY
jgi:hypothetical protein